MKNLLLLIPATSLFVALLSISPARADVKLPAIFGNHMVLQQELKAPVWGTAAAGEKITVTAGDHTATTTAGEDGKWRVDLAPFPPQADALTLTVTGHNTVKLEDVLVGEVWVASGQSNMEVPVNWMADAADVTAKAADSQLRLFYVGHATALAPVNDVTGEWKVCTSQVANDFSGVAYFFGRELRAHLKRPVGIIGSYVGGTPAEAWISLSGLQKEPPFQNYVDKFERAKTSSLDYPGQLSRAQANLDQWTEQYQAALADALSHWKADMRNSSQGNNPLPPPPVVQPPTPIPILPGNLAGDRHTPSVLFNALIAPLMPYGIKGVIWYQGEDNAITPQLAVEYRTLFPRLITDWREKWGEGDFPFLFVQLAGYAGAGGPDATNWPLAREAQAKTLSLPKTGMATATDIGAGPDIHPRDKLDVGLRLALNAEHIAYGEKLVYAGPTYEKMTVDGKTIRVSFMQTGGGLVIGSAPWTAPGLQPIPTTSLVGFTIAGADKKFVAADAKIDGTTVVLSSPQIATPVAVRYYWDNLTQANLYNKEGLPAFPFRSDDWDEVASPANPPGNSAK